MLLFLDTRAPQDVLRAVVKKEEETKASKRMLVANKTKTQSVRSLRLASGIRFRRADGVLRSIERKSRAVSRPLYNVPSGEEAHPVVRAAAADGARPYGELSKQVRKALFRQVTRWLDRSFGLATEYEGEDAQLADSIKMLYEHVQDMRARDANVEDEQDANVDEDDADQMPSPGASSQALRDWYDKTRDASYPEDEGDAYARGAYDESSDNADDASDLQRTEPPSPNASPLWEFPEIQQTGTASNPLNVPADAAADKDYETTEP
jgi:hypothetical protein